MPMFLCCGPKHFDIQICYIKMFFIYISCSDSQKLQLNKHMSVFSAPVFIQNGIRGRLYFSAFDNQNLITFVLVGSQRPVTWFLWPVGEDLCLNLPIKYCWNTLCIIKLLGLRVLWLKSTCDDLMSVWSLSFFDSLNKVQLVMSRAPNSIQNLFLCDVCLVLCSGLDI